MLHMQHAQVVALIVRRQEAARLKARRDAIVKARRAAAAAGPADAQPATAPRATRVPRPRAV